MVDMRYEGNKFRAGPLLRSVQEAQARVMCEGML
jgi:hypothetical protein